MVTTCASDNLETASNISLPARPTGTTFNGVPEDPETYDCFSDNEIMAFISALPCMQLEVELNQSGESLQRIGIRNCKIGL